MKVPRNLEDLVGRLNELRRDIRPWRILLWIGILGVIFIGLLAVSIRYNSMEAAKRTHQIVAIQQIQQHAAELLLAIESHASAEGTAEITKRLEKMDSFARGLLEGGQVDGLEIPAFRDAALRDSILKLSEVVTGFHRAVRAHLEFEEDPSLGEESLESIHLNFRDMFLKSRPLQANLRARLRNTDRNLVAIQYSMMALIGVFFIVIALLLSTRARRRLRDVLQIRQTLERYDAALENAPLGYQSLDGKGRLIAVNQAWLDMLGYSREEVLSAWMGDYLQPQAAELFEGKFAQFKKEGSVRNLEMPMQRRDGTALMVSLDGKVERDERGRFIRTHCSVKDVSAQNAAEQALRSRERQQAAVAELGHEALAGADLQGLFDKTVHAVAETLDVEFCKVLELTEDSQSLRLRAGIGWDDGLVGVATVPLGENSQAGFTLLSNNPVIVDDLAGDRRFTGPALLIDHGIVSGMSVIIGSRSFPLGILGAHTREKRKFSNEDINFLQSVANLLAAAISRLKREDRIRERESELRNLFEHTPVSIGKQDMSELFVYLKELRGGGVTDFRSYFQEQPEEVTRAARMVRVLDVNRTCVALHGAARKEDLLFTLDNIFTPKAMDCYIEELVALAEGRREFMQPSEIITLGGEVKDIFVKLLVDPSHTDGSLVYVSAIDMSDLRRAEQALGRSEELLRTVVDNAVDVIFLKDEQQRFTLVNPAQVECLGMAAEEILGKRSRELLEDEFADIIEAAEDRVLAGETVHSEYSRLVDEQLRYFSVLRVPTRDQNGKVSGICGISRDMTSEYRARQELVQLATAIEQAGEVVVITDRDGIIQYVNPVFEQISGYARAEVLGRSPSILRSDAQDDDFYRNLWETILRGEIWSGSFVNRHKDGSLYHEKATISPVRDRMGEITNFVAVKHDITQQIELEDRIRHAQRMEAVGHLAGGLAHDFNNILQSMLGFLEFAREGLDPLGQRSRDLDEVSKGADRAITLTRELLTIGRKRKVDLKPIDLGKTLHSSLEMLRPMLNKNIYLEFVEPDEPVVIEADAVQLERVVSNLCVNARDAMLEGGKLRIEIERVLVDEEFATNNPELSVGPHARFSITDTGEGISAEKLGHIFDPFYSTKDVGEGTGLGLAVVHGIISQHGGLIEVESKLGRGTRFSVTLPESQAQEQDEKNPPRHVLQ